MTAPIANGESGSSVRTKLNSIIVEVDGLGTAATTEVPWGIFENRLACFAAMVSPSLIDTSA